MLKFNLGNKNCWNDSPRTVSGDGPNLSSFLCTAKYELDDLQLLTHFLLVLDQAFRTGGSDRKYVHLMCSMDSPRDTCVA
jgi:hypothetical protein